MFYFTSIFTFFFLRLFFLCKFPATFYFIEKNIQIKLFLKYTNFKLILIMSMMRSDCGKTLTGSKNLQTGRGIRENPSGTVVNKLSMKNYVFLIFFTSREKSNSLLDSRSFEGLNS